MALPSAGNNATGREVSLLFEYSFTTESPRMDQSSSKSGSLTLLAYECPSGVEHRPLLADVDDLPRKYDPDHISASCTTPGATTLT
jgi:hypothetical protein